MQVAAPGDQVCNWCKYSQRAKEVKFVINATGTIWWPNLQPIVVLVKSILPESFTGYWLNTLGPLCLWQCFFLIFFVILPVCGDCHAELSLVGVGVVGGRVSYGRSVTHLGSLASLSLSPSFARESSQLTTFTWIIWGIRIGSFKMHNNKHDPIARLAKLITDMVRLVAFAHDAKRCFFPTIFRPFCKLWASAAVYYHTKDSPPQLPTIPPRRSIIKQSDFNFSFCEREKPKNIEIGFPDDNSKFGRCSARNIIIILFKIFAIQTRYLGSGTGTGMTRPFPKF